ESRARHDARLEERPRAVVRLHAPGEPVDVLEGADGVALRRREEPVPLVDRIGPAEQAARDHAKGVVVVLRQLQAAIGVSRGRVQLEVVTGLVVEVGPHTHLAEVARLVDSQLLGVVYGDVESRLVGSPRRGDTVRLPRAGAERAVGDERVEGLELGLRALARRDRREETLLPGIDGLTNGLVVRGPVGDIVQRPTLAEDVPPRLPWPSALGLVDDDTVGGIGPVQDGGGWPLHDFHGFDVVRVDVVDPRGRLSSHADGIRHRPVFYANPVHYDHRLVRERDTVRATDTDPRAGSRGATPRLHEHSRRA